MVLIVVMLQWIYFQVTARVKWRRELKHTKRVSGVCVKILHANDLVNNCIHHCLSVQWLGTVEYFTWKWAGGKELKWLHSVAYLKVRRRRTKSQWYRSHYDQHTGSRVFLVQLREILPNLLSNCSKCTDRDTEWTIVPPAVWRNDKRRRRAKEFESWIPLKISPSHPPHPSIVKVHVYVMKDKRRPTAAAAAAGASTNVY